MTTIEGYRTELKDIIYTKMIDPYSDNEEEVEDTSLYFAKNLLATHDPELDEAINLIIKNRIEPECFINTCQQAYYLSAAFLKDDNLIDEVEDIKNKNIEIIKERITKEKKSTIKNILVKQLEAMQLPKKNKYEGRTGRMAPKAKDKALKNILNKIESLKKALTEEPAPQMLCVSDLRKHLLKVEASIEDEIKSDIHYSNKPSASSFCQHLHEKFESFQLKLNYKHIAAIVRACSNFEGTDENTVKTAVFNDKKRKS